MTLEALVTQLRAAYGAELLAVVLYGSSAGGEAHTGHSDQNVLVLVQELRAAAVPAAGAALRAWQQAGHAPLLTLTGAEWRSSVDVFAMEHADILERHRVLWAAEGMDVAAGIAVSRADIRQQLEYEAMAILLRLRTAMLSSSDDAAKRVHVLAASAGQVLVIFRTLARLTGDSAAMDNEALVRAVSARAGIEAAPFVAVVLHRRGDEKITAARAADVLMAYHAGLEQLVAYLDALPAAQ